MNPKKQYLLLNYLVFDNLRAAFKLKFIEKIARQFFTVKNKKLERNVLGLHFPNPVGLAAGLDKDAKLFNELSALGFGHIEIGTLTPKAQPGNDQPRLFRLPEDEGLINRMGFNNKGVIAAANNLKKRKDKTLPILSEHGNVHNDYNYKDLDGPALGPKDPDSEKLKFLLSQEISDNVKLTPPPYYTVVHFTETKLLATNFKKAIKIIFDIHF